MLPRRLCQGCGRRQRRADPVERAGADTAMMSAADGQMAIEQPHVDAATCCPMRGSAPAGHRSTGEHSPRSASRGFDSGESAAELMPRARDVGHEGPEREIGTCDANAATDESRSSGLPVNDRLESNPMSLGPGPPPGGGFNLPWATSRGQSATTCGKLSLCWGEHSL
jgi:hypothetical protein